jgi:hypothetical protein
MAKRGKIPSLISRSNGKPNLVTATRKRTCKRCQCLINAGQKLFEYPKSGNGFSNLQPVCLSCFKEIIDQTESDLLKIKENWREAAEVKKN